MDSLRHSEIVFRFALLNRTARCARIFIIVQMRPSDTDHSLHAPTVAQQPLVTIGQTGSVEVALITIILHIFTQEFDPADIIIGIMGMHSEKMAVKLLT